MQCAKVKTELLFLKALENLREHRRVLDFHLEDLNKIKSTIENGRNGLIDLQQQIESVLQEYQESNEGAEKVLVKIERLRYLENLEERFEAIRLTLMSRRK